MFRIYYCLRQNKNENRLPRFTYLDYVEKLPMFLGTSENSLTLTTNGEDILSDVEHLLLMKWYTLFWGLS